MRNPLTDPMPGDVVIYGPQWQRERAEVLGRDGNVVEYRIHDFELRCSIHDWCRWMQNAEIVHRGGE